MNVACVSDISLGYGSPQILFLLRSLRDYTGSMNRPLVLEIHQPERPPVHDRYPDIEMIRVYTDIHPHSNLQYGRVQYIRQCARILNERQPEIVVVPNTFSLPVLFRLTYRPKVAIYYVLEMPSAYGFNVEEHGLNVLAKNKVDLVIYPEWYRAKTHMNTYGYHELPEVILFNVSPVREEPIIPAEQRNGRILHQGTLHDRLTGGDRYCDPEIRQMPIDLYGLLEGYNEAWKEDIRAGGGRVQYCGYVDATTLRSIRQYYSFSIVWWSPASANTLYACPNKFFESVADGIPPLTAPHPQTKMLVERYDCGLVMPDWSFEAFRDTLKQALALKGTRRYEQMVKNCVAAHREELNWGMQFRRLESSLQRLGVPRQSGQAAAASFQTAVA